MDWGILWHFMYDISNNRLYICRMLSSDCCSLLTFIKGMWEVLNRTQWKLEQLDIWYLLQKGLVFVSNHRKNSISDNWYLNRMRGWIGLVKRMWWNLVKLECKNYGKCFKGTHPSLNSCHWCCLHAFQCFSKGQKTSCHWQVGAGT